MPDKISEPIVHDLANRIMIRIDDNPDPNAFTPLTVTIKLKNGKDISATREFVLGHPSRPLNREDHLAKFRLNCALARPSINKERAEALIDRTDQLESEPDVSRLVDLMIA